MAQPITTPWAKIEGSLRPLIPAPAPPPVFAPVPDGGMPSLPETAAPRVLYEPQGDFSDAPKLQKIEAPSKAPKVFASAPVAANVQLTADPMERMVGHEQNRLEAFERKDANPFGSANNHPGFGGKLAHVFAKIGNIAGDIVAPGVMARIPGTDLNRQMEEQGLKGEIQGLEDKEATNALGRAQAANLTEETKEMPDKTASNEALQGAEATNLNSEANDRDAALKMGPSLAVAYAHRVQEVLKAGGDPSQDPLTQHLADAITAVQRQSAETGPKTIQKQVNGKPHTFAYDPATKDYTRDEGETGEKPPTVRVETPGEQLSEKNALLKAYQPTLDSAERMNVMTESYERAVKDHDQQAMLNLLYNHMGMTMGLQKGARMTQDLIHEAEKSQPWLQGLKAKFDKNGYLTGVNLSPMQMRQMVDLARQRYIEDAKKSRSTAGYLGAKDDGPKRIPGAATIRYYTALAGGDPAKAKQMAAEDGWSVK